MEQFEGGLELEPWAYIDRTYCCDRCGCPVDPAFTAHGDGYLCVTCFANLEEA